MACGTSLCTVSSCAVRCVYDLLQVSINHQIVSCLSAGMSYIFLKYDYWTTMEVQLTLSPVNTSMQTYLVALPGTCTAWSKPSAKRYSSARGTSQEFVKDQIVQLLAEGTSWTPPRK